MFIVDNWENTKSTKKRNMDSAIPLSSGQHHQHLVWLSFSMWMQRCALSKLPQAHESLQAYPLPSISLLAPSILLDEEKENQRGEVLKSCVCVLSGFSHVWLFATPWTAAHQAPLSMEIVQTRILEWVVIPSSRGSSQPRGQTQVSHTAGGFFTVLATRAAHNLKFSKIFQYCLQTGFYVVSLKIKSLNQLIHASYSLDNLYKHFKCKVHKTLHTI